MAEEKNNKRLSPQTQAIIDRLKAEGDLVRNSGTNSIKVVKAELSKFTDVFQAMNISLGGLSKQSAATLALAEQDAKLRALSNEERDAFYKKEAEMAQRQQELDNQKLIKQEKKAAAEKRERKSWFSGIKGLFGGILGFFKKWGMILAGTALGYQFIAGWLEGALGIKLPTIKETITKMNDWLKSVDWDELGNTFRSLVGLSPLVIGLGVAMTSATFWLKGLPALMRGMLTGSFKKPPAVNPGTAGRPGTTLAPGTPGTTTTPGGETRRLRDYRVLKDPETGKFVKNTWWNRLKLFGNADLPGGKYAPGAVGAAVSAGQIALGIANEERLSADASQEELLAAAYGRRKTFEQVAMDTTLSMGAGALLGAGTGALAGGVGAVPGAAAGAVSGAAWGFATSIIDGVVREFRDFGETGVDELPNTIQYALEDEMGLTGEALVSSLMTTRDVAQQFIDENKEAIEKNNEEIAELEQKLEEAGTNNRRRRSIEAEIKRRRDDFEILQTQYDVAQTIVQRKQQELETLKRERESLEDLYSQPPQAFLTSEERERQLFFEQLNKNAAEVAAGLRPPIVVRQGDVNNFNTTSMQRSSTGVYRLNSVSGGNGGTDRAFVAIPGLAQ